MNIERGERRTEEVLRVGSSTRHGLFVVEAIGFDIIIEIEVICCYN
jgi:hypothetical protein